MPLWMVYHPPNTFATAESKQFLAADITAVYTSYGLPAFYVVVTFVPVPPENVFLGGQARNGTEDRPFVRFVVDHIAVRLGEDAAARMAAVRARLAGALRPHVADKGYDWEMHIDETPRGLWLMNGLAPPPFRSEAEKRWSEINRPEEYESTTEENLNL